MKTLIGMLLVGAAWAQEPPSFEVASVKPVSQDVMESAPTRSPGRITWTTDLWYLIGYAYRLQPNRMSGPIPGSDHLYQVIATIKPNTSEDQVRLMLRSLLAERFQMRTHRETKEAERWELALVKGGVKMKEAAPSETSAPGDGRVVSTIGDRGIVGKLVGQKASAFALCETLQRHLGVYVVDATGLKGTYDFSLQYANRPGETDEAPLPAALQRELGLRLEKGKGPVDMLVVDRISAVPTEN